MERALEIIREEIQLHHKLEDHYKAKGATGDQKKSRLHWLIADILEASERRIINETDTK